MKWIEYITCVCLCVYWIKIFESLRDDKHHLLLFLRNEEKKTRHRFCEPYLTFYLKELSFNLNDESNV